MTKERERGRERRRINESERLEGLKDISHLGLSEVSTGAFCPSPTLGWHITSGLTWDTLSWKRERQRERVKKRDRERQREWKRERKRERKRDRQREWKRERERQREWKREREKMREREKERKKERAWKKQIKKVWKKRETESEMVTFVQRVTVSF